ncbi:MAG: hypothetical protein ACXVPN_03485 [Bacteroidia bacterium]
MPDFNIDSLLNNISERDMNKWADTIELMAIFSNEKFITASAIADRQTDILNVGIGLEEEAYLVENELLEFSSQDSFELLDEKDEGMAGEFFSDISDQENNLDDRTLIKIRSKFDFFEYRVKNYNSHYPFIFDKVEKKLIFKGNDLTEKEQFYIILLISSNLDVFRAQMSFLTSQFERICYYIFERMMPKNSRIIYCGASLKVFDEQIQTLSRNKLIEKIGELELLLKWQKHRHINEESIGKYNVGDNGLDIIGYCDYEDDVASKLVMVGQCACGQNWYSKQIESNKINLDRIYHFFNSPNSVLFIPHSFRAETNEWSNVIDIMDSILIDRYRLIKLSMEFPSLEHLITNYSELLNEIMLFEFDFFA